MAKIRIEWVPIKVMNLGLLGFYHLQLVFQQDDDDTLSVQDTWFVIEGVKGKPLLETLGSDGVTTLSEANGGMTGAALVEEMGTPGARGSRVLQVSNAFAAWETMATHAGDIDSEFTYSALGLAGTARPESNSSSLIASLLYYADIDVATNLPFNMRRSPGLHTLLGTQSDDHLTTTSWFSVVQAGRGDDTVEGGDSSEKLYGGRGDDVIHWSNGLLDIIHGGQWGLAYAEDGNDTVDYTGVGQVLIRKGVFATPNASPDYIVYRTGGGADHLYSIERVEWSAANDELILDADVRILEEGLLMKMGASGGGAWRHAQFRLAGRRGPRQPDGDGRTAAVKGRRFHRSRQGRLDRERRVDHRVRSR